MTLDFTTNGEVRDTMIYYPKGVINNFPEIITGISVTPATSHMFDVCSDEEWTGLGKEQARAFHHSVVQLLFASVRNHKDKKPTVALLATRVKSPDEDDWQKLKRLLTYI
jgi:hypothetical protein